MLFLLPFAAYAVKAPDKAPAQPAAEVAKVDVPPPSKPKPTNKTFIQNALFIQSLELGNEHLFDACEQAGLLLESKPVVTDPVKQANALEKIYTKGSSMWAKTPQAYTALNRYNRYDVVRSLMKEVESLRKGSDSKSAELAENSLKSELTSYLKGVVSSSRFNSWYARPANVEELRDRVRMRDDWCVEGDRPACRKQIMEIRNYQIDHALYEYNNQGGVVSAAMIMSSIKSDIWTVVCRVVNYVWYPLLSLLAPLNPKLREFIVHTAVGAVSFLFVIIFTSQQEVNHKYMIELSGMLAMHEFKRVFMVYAPVHFVGSILSLAILRQVRPRFGIDEPHGWVSSLWTSTFVAPFGVVAALLWKLEVDATRTSWGKFNPLTWIRVWTGPFVWVILGNFLATVGQQGYLSELRLTEKVDWGLGKIPVFGRLVSWVLTPLLRFCFWLETIFEKPVQYLIYYSAFWMFFARAYLSARSVIHGYLRVRADNWKHHFNYFSLQSQKIEYFQLQQYISCKQATSPVKAKATRLTITRRRICQKVIQRYERKLFKKVKTEDRFAVKMSHEALIKANPKDQLELQNLIFPTNIWSFYKTNMKSFSVWMPWKGLFIGVAVETIRLWFASKIGAGLVTAILTAGYAVGPSFLVHSTWRDRIEVAEPALDDPQAKSNDK